MTGRDLDGFTLVNACAPEWDHPLATIAVPAYRDLSGDDVDQVLRSFAQMRDSGPMTRLAAMRSGQPVGFVAPIPKRIYLDPQMPSWQVWWLAVAERARRGGIARSLLGELESRARAQDVGRLWLWTWGRAHAARACYAAAGWDPIHRMVFELDGDARGAIETHWVYLRQLHAPALAINQLGAS